MPSSQFTIYTSNDIGGPGQINGQTGSLIGILDACLVNGYTGKPAVGWTHPIATTGSYACYIPPSGSRHTMFVNDSGPNATSLGKEAGITGWLTMTSLSASAIASVLTPANNTGTGYGQFPQPTQLLTWGRVIWRKSVSADNIGRNWIIAADAYTMYIWLAGGDVAGSYWHGGFGDFYSFYGTADVGRCYLFGRAVENDPSVTITAPINDGGDAIAIGPYTQGSTAFSSLASAIPGCYIARSPSGKTSSIPFTKKGDGSLCLKTVPNANNSQMWATMAGCLACPNPQDNNFYVSPVWVYDPAVPSLRGRYRGIFQILHPPTNFVDGQIITCGGDYSDKTFMIIKTGHYGGFWALEISTTIDTN